MKKPIPAIRKRTTLQLKLAHKIEIDCRNSNFWPDHGFSSPQLSKNTRPRDASPLIYLIRIKIEFSLPIIPKLNVNIV